MQQININVLKPHPRNNEFFDDLSGEEWNEFLESIRTSGVIEPIVITTDMIIVSGHQRVRACKELGIITIMGEINFYDDEEDVFLNMLLSNLNRVKDIPSVIKRCAIVSEIEKIYNKRETQIKKVRDELVHNYRNEITKYRKDILSNHQNKCDICGFDLFYLLEIHHILPLQQGGNNSLTNISCLCPNCHSIIHKFISHFCNDNVDIDGLTKWLEENYTQKSYLKVLDMYGKYIEKKEKYGWEDLTWI